MQAYDNPIWLPPMAYTDINAIATPTINIAVAYDLLFRVAESMVVSYFIFFRKLIISLVESTWSTGVNFKLASVIVFT